MSTHNFQIDAEILIIHFCWRKFISVVAPCEFYLSKCAMFYYLDSNFHKNRWIAEKFGYVVKIYYTILRINITQYLFFLLACCQKQKKDLLKLFTIRNYQTRPYVGKQMNSAMVVAWSFWSNLVISQIFISV